MLSQDSNASRASLKEKLADGGTVVGSWINTGSPIVAELMAQAGFDFLTIDAEHSAVDLSQVQQLMQAIRSGNPDCTPLVRVPGCDYAQIKRYMDAGAGGVICPLVNSAEQAQVVVDAVKYPGAGPQTTDHRPQTTGRRGVGFCRDNMYGIRLEERVAEANADTLVCVQIEHADAVENIDHILAVEGVDAAFIGPYDLSASLGITARFDHPRMVDAMEQILSACRRHDVVPGVHVVPPDTGEVAERLAEGYRLIAYSLDITMLSKSCRDGLAAIRGS